MKTPLLAVALLMVPVTSVLAWPFVARTTGTSMSFEDAVVIQGFQADKSRAIELFIGGPNYIKLSGGLAGDIPSDVVSLPAPDTDPYPPSFPVSFGGGRGVTGDIDNDGDTDVVYTATVKYQNSLEEGNARIVACLNDGNGGWTRGWQYKNTTLGYPDVPEVRLADFDRDGDLDLLESSEGLVIRWNDGAGNFSTKSSVLHGMYPAMPGYSTTPGFEVGDFDGNGWQDFALFAEVRLNADDTQYEVTGRATVYYNQNGTNFVTSTFGQNSLYDPFLQTSVGDLDADGRMDLLASRVTDNGGELVWYRNTGSNFATGIILVTLTNSVVYGVAGDLDGDGKQDLVFTGPAGEVMWRRSAGGGSFDPAEAIKSGASGTTVITEDLGVADMDGDGDNDIFARSGNVILENVEPHGRSAATPTTFAGTALTGAVDLATGDLNNDGFPDLLAADGGANRVRWYTGGSATLTEQLGVSTGSGSPLSVTAGDWNGDGWTDLAWSTNGILRQAVSSSGTGVGWNFSDAATLPGISRLLTADMDRDGDLDILSSTTTGVLRVHTNNGGALWLPQTVDGNFANISRIALGEIKPGGRPEITALGTTQVSSWRYNAAWVKTPMVNLSAGNASRGLCMANVSDNLAGDEVIYSLNFNSVYVLHDNLQNGPLIGNFDTPVVELTPVDWNRDGYTDILVTTTAGIYLLVHQVSPNAVFEAPVQFFAPPAGKTLQDTVALDVNRDGLMDAVTADSAGALYLLTNSSYVLTSSLSPVVSRGGVPGGSLEVGRFHATSHSTSTKDASVYPARIFLSFNRAVGTPGSDVVGTPMTDAEISALVNFGTLHSPGSPANSYLVNGTAVMLGGGQVALAVNPTTKGAVSSVIPDRDYILSLRLKSGAASAPVSRFFVTITPGINWAAVNSQAEVRYVRSRTDSASQRTLFYIREASPLELWRTQYFGGPDENYLVTGAAANGSDFDEDGFPNLMEYIMGLDPTASGGLAASPVVGATYDTARGTLVADLRLLNSYDSRVKLTLQYSVDPSAGWGSVATRTGTAAWTGTVPYSTTNLAGGRTRFQFDKGLSPSTFPRAFYRLKAEELP